MFECFDSGGEKIRRVGVASVKREISNLANITDEGEDVWASVSCPDAGVYLVNYDKIYTVSWFQDDELHELDLKTKQKAVDKFLELRKGAMCSV